MGILWGGMILLMLCFPKSCAQSAWEGVQLWAKFVLPSLFPMMIVMLLFSSRIGKSPRICLLLGLLSGSPGGAKLLSGLDLSRENNLHAAAVTGVMSPMFLLLVMPSYFQAPQLGPLLLIAHHGGALLTGLFFPGKWEKEHAPPKPLSLTEAILEAAASMIAVCGCILLGRVLSGMLQAALPLPPVMHIALQLLTEVTGGLHTLGQTDLPQRAKGLIGVMCASFGGASLILQNGAYWREKGIGILRLTSMRLLHALLSGVLFALLYR